MIISGERAGIGSSPEEPAADAVAPPPPGPPSASFPGPQDLTGRRVAAALIDIVLLTGLFVIMSVTVGTFRVGGGGFDIFLYGGWVLVYFALLLVYFFTLEAVAGQTVGKILLGLRVARPDGSRPSAAAIAGRTLLRIIDWLPLLYLAGFITMMATGARRQRLGDLAARTAIARAAPPRRRGLLAGGALALVIAAAAGLSAYRTTSPAAVSGAYHGHGVSFDYPAAWVDESAQSSSIGHAGAPSSWTAVVGPGTQLDSISVQASRMKQPLTAGDLDIATPNLESRLQQLFTIQGGPEKITMAGMPGLRFHATGTVEGARFQSTLVFAFNGTTEYYVNCQYTPAKAAEVLRACDQVTGSFHTSGAAPGAAAPGTRPPSPGATSTTTPSAASTTPGASPASGMSGNGRRSAKVVPAPSGFTLFQDADVHNGPMNAADFNQYMAGGDLAATLHFVRGYDVWYTSNSTSDLIEVTLLQFATPQDATAFKTEFKTDFVVGEPDILRADAVIPAADDYDSTSPQQGIYDHGVITTKGNQAFVIDDVTGSAAPVPLVETMARQQYAAL